MFEGISLVAHISFFVVLYFNENSSKSTTTATATSTSTQTGTTSTATAIIKQAKQNKAKEEKKESLQIIRIKDNGRGFN